MNKKQMRIIWASTCGGCAFAIAFILGTPLNLAFGPAMGGIVNSIITSMIIAISCRGVEKFPYAVITWIAFSIPAIFTFTMGPQGIHKILVAIVTGLIMELSFLLLGRKSLSYFITGGLMSITMTFLIFISIILFGLGKDLAEKLSSALSYLLPIYFILGGIGMYLGRNTFDKNFTQVLFISRLK